MKVATNTATIEAIQEVMTGQEGAPKSVRIFVAGMGCSGPTLGLALDAKKDNDVVDDTNDITFVMEKELYDKMGEIKVEFMGEGYLVAPVVQAESACGSCGGSCG